MARKPVKLDLDRKADPAALARRRRLYTGSSGDEQSPGMELLSLRLEVIEPDPNQPRTQFPEKTLAELADSVREEGVIQPIEVTQIGPGEYQIVHGERRWRAAQIAGLETILAVVRRQDYPPPTRLIRQLIENIQREDLNDVDRANALVELRTRMQLELDAQLEVGTTVPTSPWSSTITWANVGKRVGLSRRRITQIIQILALPESIQEDVRRGAISEYDTRSYRGLPTEKQEELHTVRSAVPLEADQVRQAADLLRREDGVSVRDAVAAVQETAPKPEPKPQPAPRPHRESTEIRRLIEIRRHLTNFKPDNLPAVELQEALRLLENIQSEVVSIRDRLQERARIQEAQQGGTPH